jgi:SAM-dependent methyltransferase
VGLELSQQAVDAAKARKVTLLRRPLGGFAEEFPESYDVTCAFQVVEHVQEPLAFISAMNRLTKPGGTIILSAPNGEGYISRCRDLLNAPPHHFTWWEDLTWQWVRDRFDFSSVELYHTSISEVLTHWATMVASDGMARLMGARLHPVVDETPLRRRIDEMAARTAQIIANGLRHRNDVPPPIMPNTRDLCESFGTCPPLAERS